MDQSRMPLVEAIDRFGRENPAYFRIPGHRFARGINAQFRELAGEGLFRLDLSEAEGLDDLHQPEGVIRKAQELAAQLWGAKETFFLVNGTTCGNEAMVLGCAGPGDRVLIPRNAHKSILMGLIMSGAEPCYLMPAYDREWNLWGSVAPRAVGDKISGCKAVYLVSPTYYGVCSDLRGISVHCRREGALLCVDEAHGSHLYFSDVLPEGALQQGADLCAQSIHKTAGSLTQSSMLQVGSSRVDRERVASALQMVQSTSPSYVLMASLDAARQEMAVNGRVRMERAVSLAGEARARLGKIPGIQVLGKEREGTDAVFRLDPTRLVFSARELGISGFRLQGLLYERFRVSTELADEENVVCVVTAGNTEEEIRRLTDGVLSIAEDKALRGPALRPQKWAFSLPPRILNPREAYFSRKHRVRWEEAAGKVSAEMIVPYPPGIPLVCPGEQIDGQTWQRVEACRRQGISIHGPADSGLEYLQIID